MLMIRPYLRGSMCLATAWATKKVPRRLVSSTLFQSSQVISSAGLRTLHPALLTRMSIRPKAAWASSPIWRMLASSRTSRARPATLRPSPSISRAKASVSSFLRAVMIRSAPARARARPKYCPRPRLAPVTRATRPDRSKKFFTMGLPVRLEEDLHQAGLLAVQPLEPAGPILQGGLGRDEAVDVDLARGD